MKISQQFNKLFHGGILNALFNRAGHLTMFYLDPETGMSIEFLDSEGNPFILQKGIEYSTMDELKQLLKLFNFQYPSNWEKKKSTRDLTTAELLEHAKFIEEICNSNRIDISVFKEEAERFRETWKDY